jgi:hypothetical protein
VRGIRINMVARDMAGLSGLDATLDRFYLGCALVRALRDAHYIRLPIECACKQRCVTYRRGSSPQTGLQALP